ncbi:MAG: amidohydrolase [Myxococcales bacterium]|nr:amidohydrolase [Myxococcales bacterium]
MLGKRARLAFAFAFTLLAFAACGAPPAPQLPAPPGDPIVLLHGGRIFTGDAARPRAEALAFAGDEILAVGSDDEVRRALGARAAAARSIDLAGRWVLPGFIDAHAHILGGGFALAGLDLSGLETRAAILAAVVDWAARHPERAAITGRGWSYQAFAPGLPTREELDRAVPDRPVWLRSYDGHTGWANGRALALAGLGDRAAPDEPPGVVRDPKTGRPTGALLEDAMGLVGAAFPPPSLAEREAALVRAFAHAASLGVTTLCEVGDDLGELEVYEALDARGAHTLRVVYGPSIDDGIAAYAPHHARLAAQPRRRARLLPGPLKGFVDGVIESNTAFLLAPYADGSGASPAPHLDSALLLAQLTEADALGLDVAYHAIGDAAVRSVLDAVAAARAQGLLVDRRPRIEHIEVVDAADLARFAALGVAAVMMPRHAEPGDEPDGGVWSNKVGPARLPLTFAFRSLLDAGAPLAFSSDWPVVGLAALPGLAVAATRQGADGKPAAGWVPGQRISIDEAITAYTAGAAWALRLDGVTGVLGPGLAADLVVLDASAKLEQPATLHTADVDLTIAAGRVVYERSAP